MQTGMSGRSSLSSCSFSLFLYHTEKTTIATNPLQQQITQHTHRDYCKQRFNQPTVEQFPVPLCLELLHPIFSFRFLLLPRRVISHSTHARQQSALSWCICNKPNFRVGGKGAVSAYIRKCNSKTKKEYPKYCRRFFFFFLIQILLYFFLVTKMVAINTYTTKITAKYSNKRT